MHSIKILLIFVLLEAAQAQQFEIGALGGGGFLNAAPIRGSAPVSISAGLGPGPVAGVLIGQDRYPHWSGEIRYLFAERDPRITGGRAEASFSGQTHVLQYDVVLHPRFHTQRVETYAALGGGIKVFRGTGAETAYRPLMEYAYLTRASEYKPMLALGGGIKVRLSRRLIGRVDLQEQITGFPNKVIAPAPGMALGSLLADLVPTIGLGWIF